MIISTRRRRARSRATLTLADRDALREATRRARVRAQMREAGEHAEPVHISEILPEVLRRILAREPISR